MKKKKIQLPDLNYLNSIFNIIDGELFWKISRNNNQFKVSPGDRVEILDPVSGYYRVCLDGKRYQAQNIVWKMLTGNDPIYEIDHKNHIKTDNKLENLRDTNKNTKNRSKNKNNTSGYANISISKKNIKKFSVIFRGENYTKSFETLEEAIQHRNEKYIEFGFHENHGL